MSRSSRPVETFEGPGAHTPDQPDRQRTEEGIDPVCRHDAHAGAWLGPLASYPWLGLLAGELRQVLVRGDPDAAPESLLDVHESADLRRLIGRWTEKRDRTGHIQECLVQRQRFDQGGEPPEDRHDPSADFPVVGMVAGKEDGVGAQPPGDNRRHRRVNTEDSGLVRGSGDHSPLPGSTDEYRPPTQLRMAHQLDRREERVHVDVQDRRRAAFGRVGWPGGSRRMRAAHRRSTSRFPGLVPRTRKS
jgi:hypothetical protein